MTAKNNYQGIILLFVFGIATAVLSQQGDTWGFVFEITSIVLWILFVITILIQISENRKAKRESNASQA